MKKLFVLLLLSIIVNSGKTQFIDDFSDGDFTLNPQWLGDTQKFEVNTNKQLHLIGTGADTSVLATFSSRINNTEWSFWVKLSFNTSTNNYARVYLLSDNQALKGPLIGYYLQIGGSNDSVYFMKQTGMQLEKLFKAASCCTNNSTNVVRFKMIHDSAGMWTLFADNTGGVNFKEEGHCLDPGISSTSWFGVYCQYTSSNSNKFLFDDFYVGLPRNDSIYQINSADIIIDEIMADPDPVTGLPECEYIELYNRTQYPVNLNGWIFEYGTSSKTFPNVTISSKKYLILTKGNLMNSYGPCIDIFTSESTLANDGATLVLKDALGKVIHTVTYSSSWYQNPLKENGGWSLEMIDTNNPCGCQDNWKASMDIKGGTPGSINSVHASNPDTIQPYLKRGWATSDSTVEISFSESMDSLSFNRKNKWFLDKTEFSPINLSLISPSYQSVCLTLPEPLAKKSTYLLSCMNPPIDCVGNLLDTLKQIRIGLPDSIMPGEIVINEILANPAINGERFIELYNRSQKILNLQELALGTYDSIQQQQTDLKSLSQIGLLSFPGDFSVLTKNPDDIKSRYFCPNPDAFVQMIEWPSMNSDKGTLVLARKNDGTLIDHVYYSSVMYSDLLTSTDGVSLERLNPALCSDDITNWHSASQSCGFATPGYKNSEFIGMDDKAVVVIVSPSVFTPDDDGKDDVLMIEFALEDVGYLANINIFSASGNRIRYLARNRLLATEDGIAWDGRDDKNQKAPIGIYIIYISLVKPDGKSIQMKKTCVLGGKR
jgi:hypothetical protein